MENNTPNTNDTFNRTETRSNVEDITGDLRSRANRMAGDLSDAQSWLSSNRNIAILAVGILAGAGLIGYFLSRRGRGYDEFEMRESA